MKRSAQRRRARAVEALPDAIELVVLAIRSGLSPSGAIEAIASQAAWPLRDTFTEVVHRLHRGQRLADALDAFLDQLGPAAAGFADALATADRYGLPIEPVLDRLSIDVRTERRRIAERHARTLPVKLSFPLVVCTLPSFVLLAIVPAVMGALSTLRGSLP
jgi:tight adherence protein C